jgi:hypothetical protein
MHQTARGERDTGAPLVMRSRSADPVDVVKTLAFVFGLCIGTVGVVGMLAPSSLVWIAQHSVTSGAFYLIAVVRVGFGLVLIYAASASRAPRTLRIVGYVIVVAGLATALTGLVGIERARTIIDWWLQQGAGIIRLTSVVLVALGGFVVYACVPVRRAA